MKRGKRPCTTPSLVWEEVCRKRGGGPFTVPRDKVYKTTKGEVFDLEGLTNNLAHKSVLSACYLVMLVVHMVGVWAASPCGLGFMGSTGSIRWAPL